MTGIIAISMYVILSALFSIWGFGLTQNWPLPVLLLCSFLPTIFFIFLWNKFISKNTNLALNITFRRETWVDWFWMNLMTMFCWVCTFVALSKLLPSSFSAFSYGLIPLFTIPINTFLRDEKIKRKDIFAAILIFFGLYLIGHFEFMHRLSEGYYAITLGILSSIIVALAGAASMVYGRKLNDKGIQSRTVFQHRFWMVIFAGLVWSMISQPSLPNITFVNTIQMLLLGIIGIAVPLLCMQFAVLKKGPVLASFSLGLVPVSVLILQYLTGLYTEINFLMTSGISLVCAGILIISVKLPQRLFSQNKLTRLK